MVLVGSLCVFGCTAWRRADSTNPISQLGFSALSSAGMVVMLWNVMTAVSAALS